MQRDLLFKKIRSKSRNFYRLSHHDAYHAERVYNLALRIASEEKADMDVVKASALLHDIARSREDEGEISDHAVEGAKMAKKLLETVGFPEEKISMVVQCIGSHRFREDLKGGSLEAEILQDADRLDILGAIGIARVFTRGGWSNKPIHDPNTQPKDRYDGVSLTSVNHLYEKILKVKDSINTKTAKKIAEDRHKFTKEFLDRLLKEWEAVI